MLTEEQILEIEQDLEKISQGEWHAIDNGSDFCLFGPKLPYYGSDGFIESDAKFIAKSPQRLASAVERIRELEERVKFLEQLEEEYINSKLKSSDKE